MKILRTELNLGLQEPLRILQVSDCHLSGCCEEDSEKAKAKSKKKTAGFLKEAGGVPQEQRLKEALDLSEDYDALVFTGDVADSPSYANLQLLAGMLEGRRYLYTFGNHDYYTYDSDSGNAEDRERFLDDFLRFLPCDPTMDAMEIGGVDLVTLDDSLAQFSWLQLGFLKAAHGETDPKMPAAEATQAMLELIRTEPLIQAVFASHLHFPDEAEVLGKPQFVNEPCYLDSVREIIVR